MSTLIHADIFFFVTTIVVIVLTIIFIIFLVYVIGSVRTLFHISKSIEIETNKIIGDVEELRADIKKHHRGAKAKLLIVKNFFRKIFQSRSSH